jgi:mono/diheme cytochrome c family protein
MAGRGSDTPARRVANTNTSEERRRAGAGRSREGGTMTGRAAQRQLAATTLAVLVLASPACGRRAPSVEPGPLPAALTSARARPSTPDLLAVGQRLYARQCVACHGAAGDGAGEAAYLLYPRPRDFTRGQFRLVSTWESVPTDEDLYRTISRGMPGSAMPSWGHLSEEERWGLVHYVKSFSTRPLDTRAPRAPDADGNGGEGPLAVPPEPPYDAAAQTRARQLFAEGCAGCHGPTGRGDGQREQTDSSGYPTRPRDLTAGVFKGAPEPAEVYRRIVLGLPGSPMPQNGYLNGYDAWALVHFVRALSSDEQREKVEMKRFRIVAPRVHALPSHPDAAVWREAAAVDLHLMPLWWRAQRPETATVRAVHDGDRVAFLVSWADDTADATGIRPQDFRDACAIQFSLEPDPPFFAMGERGRAVNIWMWKSERQADMQPVFQELDKVYPNIGIDSYPNLLRSPLEQPTRNALTLDSDPRFVTAWGAGNIVADPTRRSAAEDLAAEGFGTLRARPRADQAVDAFGRYETGSYSVQFTRELNPVKKGAVTLVPGARVAVAFAVWNGSAGDRDGKKSVTIWQELYLGK